jgi:large subunit ribosomal protein L19
MDILQEISREQMKRNLPDFQVGDTLRVISKFEEGGKVRKQPFEGVVIRIKGKGVEKTFTLRKISYHVGVEKTFPFYSPNLVSAKVLERGKVRRSRLYYLREKKGKGTRIKRR